MGNPGVLQVLADRYHMWPTEEHLQRLAEATSRRGSRIEGLIGWVDGTKFQIRRPGGRDSMQRTVYSGHKHVHALAYQAVMLADGLFLDVFGPLEGRRNDHYMWSESKIQDFMEERQGLDFSVDDSKYHLYGDGGYRDSDYPLIVPYRAPEENSPEAAANRSMSSLRVAVEWGFSLLKSNWGLLEERRYMVVMRFPLDVYVKAAVILTQMKTCLYGNQISKYYRLDPPPLSHFVPQWDR
jgi:nuclease HARBI1